MNKEKRKMDFGIEFGMSTQCCATLDEDDVLGKTTKTLIQDIAAVPQETEAAERTARVLKDVLSKNRPVDVEIAPGPNDYTEPGQPIGIDQVPFERNDEENETDQEPFKTNDAVIEIEQKPSKTKDEEIETEEVTLRVTEPYVGG